MLFGASGRIRTPDLLITSQLHYRLCYTSIYGAGDGNRTHLSSLEGWRTNRCTTPAYGSPSWTRTNDPAVNSRMLYRLSYGGIFKLSCYKYIISQTRSNVNMKKLFILFLTVFITFSCCACKNTPSDVSSSEAETIQQDTTQTEETEEPTEIPWSEKIKDSLEKESVYLLSATTVDYKDACIEGYMAHSEYFKKATLLTFMIDFDPNSETSTSIMKFGGDGVPRDKTVDPKDPLAEDGIICSSMSSSWVDRNLGFYLVQYRIGGEVDVNNMEIYLKKDDVKVKKDVILNKRDYNDERLNKGFRILKIDGIHYMEYMTWRYNTDMTCFILTPLDGPYNHALPAEKFGIKDVDCGYQHELSLEFENNIASTMGVLEGSTVAGIREKIFVKYKEPKYEETYNAVTHANFGLIVHTDSGDVILPKIKD